MIAVRLAGVFVALIACAALDATHAIAATWENCRQTADPDLAIDGCTSFLATATGNQVIKQITPVGSPTSANTITITRPKISAP